MTPRINDIYYHINDYKTCFFLTEKAEYVGNSYFKRKTMLKDGKDKLLVHNWLQKFEFDIEDNTTVLLELEASLTTKCTPVKIDRTVNTKEGKFCFLIMVLLYNNV